MTTIYSSDKTASPWHSRTYGNAITLTVDSSVTAMAMSPWGRDVALAGRRGLHIIDLDNPFSPPRWLRHLTSWEVADVQWSPHPQRPYWVISSSNQKGIIWNLSRSSSDAHEFILHGHERAITDINFHNEHPDILATCSVDAHCFVWDVRSSAHKPVHVCCDWETGASQIKWNHKNEYVFASAHGEWLNIWDTRFGNTPLHRIRAHDGKINGLNFNKNKETEIISCSNDHTVKLWDYVSGSLDLSFSINTDFPVLKARYLPMGRAMGIMPLRGGNNSLHIIDLPEKGSTTNLEPLHEFQGHQKPMCEFLWCKRFPKTEGRNNEFQLVTWGKDKDLRVWKTEKEFYEKVNYNYKGPLQEKDIKLANSLRNFKYCTYRNEPNATSSTNYGKITNILTSDVNWLTDEVNVNNHLQWISKVRTDETIEGQVNLQDPYNLGKELRLSRVREFPEVMFEEIFITEGKLTVSLYSSVLSHLDELLICSEKDKPVHITINSEVNIVETKETVAATNNSNVGNGDDVESPNGDEIADNNDSSTAETGNDDAASNNDNKDEADEERDSIFLRIKLHFPKNYPFKASPVCYVESNHDTNRKERDSIKEFLEYIAQKCASVDKFCLDPLFQFLTGHPVDLDAILQQDKVLSESSDDGRPGSAAKADNKTLRQQIEDKQKEEEEQDEEEEEQDEDEDDQEEELDVDEYDSLDAISDLETKDALLAAVADHDDEAIYFGRKHVVSDNFNTPGEISCGARWAPNGQLIYFSKPKSKRKTDGVFFKPDFYFNDKPVQRYELKLGKSMLKASQVQSLFTNNLYGEMTSDESEDSDDSIEGNDYYDQIASGNPFAAGALSFHNYQAQQQQQLRLKSDDNSELKRIKNVVATLDFSSILPSKMELAETYRISGKTAYDIAAHNATAAGELVVAGGDLSEDVMEISHVWDIVKVLVLSKELDSDILDFDFHSRMREYHRERGSKTKRFYHKNDWGLGLHLLGNKWLVKNILEHFERRYDIQMLAMLSCVLFEMAGTTTSQVQHNIDDDWFSNDDDDNYAFSKNILPFTNESNIDMDLYSMHDNSAWKQSIPQYSEEAPFHSDYTVINAPDFKVELKADSFLNTEDSYQYGNLFDNSLMARLRKYRDIYSDMLLSWGLPLKRVEMLKYNYNYYRYRPIDFTLGALPNSDSSSIYRMLRVAFETYSEKPLICDFCSVPVKEQRIQLCNNCHHVLHVKCGKMWFKSTKTAQNQGTEEECPSGCGCSCLKHL